MFLMFLIIGVFLSRGLNEMNKKCPQCNLINFSNAENCRRCEFDLTNSSIPQTTVENRNSSALSKIIKRTIILVTVCFFSLIGFYASLLFTSSPLTVDDRAKVNDAISILEQKGFTKEVFFLRYLTRFRSNDNWLNASTRDENAYAATNFPFEIITIYPEFFTVPQDNTERAMVLLHEAQHLKGADEKEAYEFVWRNRRALGWTQETHGSSKVFLNVRKQTKEFSPNLFQCDFNPDGDCTKYP